MNNIGYKIDSKESFDLIIIGNMTKDYLNDSTDFQLGGPSLYAGITASKLGSVLHDLIDRTLANKIREAVSRIQKVAGTL